MASDFAEHRKIFRNSDIYRKKSDSGIAWTIKTSLTWLTWDDLGLQRFPGQFFGTDEKNVKIPPNASISFTKYSFSLAQDDGREQPQADRAEKCPRWPQKQTYPAQLQQFRDSQFRNRNK